MNEDVRELKDTLGNLNTRKNTSRRILTGILSKNSELKPNLSSKLFRGWSSRSTNKTSINMSKIYDFELNVSVYSSCAQSPPPNTPIPGIIIFFASNGKFLGPRLRGEDEKRGHMPRPPSTLQHFSF